MPKRIFGCPIPATVGVGEFLERMREVARPFDHIRGKPEGEIYPESSGFDEEGNARAYGKKWRA